MRVGVAGLGRMGAAMAERLAEAGHELTVWNRSPEKTRAFADGGTAVAANPAELAARSEAIITILTDETAIEGVFRGSQALLSGDVAGKLFIEMSTVRPETQIALAADVQAAGARFIECPVGGTTGPARSGKLLGFAGGEAEDVERARPVLDALCRRLDHIGPVGAAASLKLAVNLPLLVFWQAFGEAYSLCQHLGQDPTALVALFAETSGGPNVLKARGPGIAKALAGEEVGPITFDVDLIRKDLRMMVDEARSRGFELPLVERSLAVYDEASREGWGGRDAASLAGYWPGRAAS